jgi:hypothetical protein
MQSQLSYEYSQTDSKVYMKRKKIQKSQLNIEEQQSQRLPPDFKTYLKLQ